MARIPEHEIERLKAEVSLERLAEARGVELNPRARMLSTSQLQPKNRRAPWTFHF